MYLLLVSLTLAMMRAPHARGRPLTGLLLAWPLVVIAVAPSAAAFYTSYGPLFSRCLARRRVGAVLAGGAGVALAAAALGLLLALALFGTRQPVLSRYGELAALAATFAALAAVHVAIGLVIRGFVGWWQGAPHVRTAAATVAAPVDPPRGDVIFVKTEHRLEKVRVDDILIIEGQRDYRRVHTVGRRIMTLQTFAEFERQLPAARICRVHKSYMVAVDKIDSIERGRIAIANLTIPISDTYRERFLAVIGAR